jgi:ferredoxin/flavodoxin---NADP+ reductase
MVDVATESNPLQIAIVGSGPSGFYAAEALLRRSHVHVDMYDRLPTPFGLVRGGVAPDHPKIKQVCLVYDRIAKSPNFRFLGNVSIGKDLTIDQLREAYHAVLIACGASTDRRLGIVGEDLLGSHTATEFVGWYNGHPDYQDRTFDFSHEAAVVIGQGNVAADVARMLATPVEDLKKTDITESALNALAGSRIKCIYVVGRRGPAQAKFTSVELKELGNIRDCEARCDQDDLRLNSVSSDELADVRGEENKKNFEIFRSFAMRPPGSANRCIYFRFLESSKRINGTDRVTSITLVKNRLDGKRFEQRAVTGTQTCELQCGLVFRSVGYRGIALPGVSFDQHSGTIPNMKGRCLASDGKPEPGIYVTGWIKRGPSGLIGTNRADSVETVESLLADFARLDCRPKPGVKGIVTLLDGNVQVVNYAGWLRIDICERRRGEERGKPREKFTCVNDMLTIADQQAAVPVVPL